MNGIESILFLHDKKQAQRLLNDANRNSAAAQLKRLKLKIKN